MATSLDVSMKLVLTALFTNPLDLSTPEDSLRLTETLSLANGSSANQANLIWHDRRTVTGAAETLDLSGGVTNAFGVAVSFTKIKAIIILVNTVTAGYVLTIGNAAAPIVAMFNAGTDRIKIGAGGMLVLTSPVDGYTVTNTTADGLKVDPGANTIEYDIIVIGN